MIDAVKETPMTLIDTPIRFTSITVNSQTSGILKTIADVKAFQEGAPGSETVEELAPYQDRIITVPGKRGSTRSLTPSCIRSCNNAALSMWYSQVL